MRLTLIAMFKVLLLNSFKVDTNASAIEEADIQIDIADDEGKEIVLENTASSLCFAKVHHFQAEDVRMLNIRLITHVDESIIALKSQKIVNNNQDIAEGIAQYKAIKAGIDLSAPGKVS